jgi:hypothetical protein
VIVVRSPSRTACLAPSIRTSSNNTQDLTEYITKERESAVSRGGFKDIWKCTNRMDQKLINVRTTIMSFVVLRSGLSFDAHLLPKDQYLCILSVILLSVSRIARRERFLRTRFESKKYSAPPG